MASSTTTALLLRRLPLLRSSPARSATSAVAAIVGAALSRRHLPGFSSADDPAVSAARPPLKSTEKLTDEKDFRRWKEREAEILRDVQQIVVLAKEILHSNRYRDGEKLNEEDEELIVQKLLKYHPSYEDKIGCGLEAIMVDKHPQFTRTRCLFVIRTDGAWIDFSYQKCILAYIRKIYPSHADKFIKEHFRRSLK